MRLAIVDIPTPMPLDIDTPEGYERLKGPDNPG